MLYAFILIILVIIIFLVRKYLQSRSNYPIPKSELKSNSLKLMTGLIFVEWKTTNPVASMEEWQDYLNNTDKKMWLRKHGHLGSDESINDSLRKSFIIKYALWSEEIQNGLAPLFLENLEMNQKVDIVLGRNKPE